ncbi:MAG TPA: ABC transporter permease [Solirubrobacterales bacterium]|nr:ABC transporter permease [Solirubrobacterales bacterium]
MGSRTLRTKARRDMRRQRGSFLAIALTIFLGVALFGASYDAYRNLDASYRGAFTEYRFANLTVTGGRIGPLAREARGTPGVGAVQERTQADLPLHIGRDKFLGRVVGLPPGGQPAVDRVEVESGGYLRPSQPDGVLVEKHMAEAFDLAVGDTVTVVGAAGPVPVRIVGVASSPEYFWPARSRQDILPAPKDFGVLFAPERLARRLAGASGPDQAAIYYSGGGEDPALTAKLSRDAAGLGASDVLTRADQPSNSALQQDVKSFRELAVLFPLLFLTAAALATGVLMRRLVTAQRPTIGMLRACGRSRREVVAHYLTFGVVAGLAGGVLGAAAGIGLAGAATDAYTSELSIPITLTSISPLTALVGVLFGLLTGSLAAALPAFGAARVPPAEAMRRFAPARTGGLSLAERLLPPLRRLPVRWRMTIRGVGRNPRRSLSTILGVVLALTLILVSWGMIDTTQILVDRQYSEIDRQDAELYFRGALDRQDMRRLRQAAGVAEAEAGVDVPVALRADGRSYQTALKGFNRDTTMHGFRSPGGGTTELPRKGLLAGEALGSKLGVGVGEQIEVGAPGTGASARAQLKGFLEEPLGTYVYAPLGQIRRLAGSRAGLGNVAYVRYAPGVDREAMRRRLSDLPGVVAFGDSKALRDTVDEYLGLFYVFVGIMLIFGAAMAFALLYNSIQANLAERAVEVATLRAAGIRFRSLSRMITAENVIVTAIGIVPGLLVGVEVSRLFLASFSSDAFSFELQIRASTLVLSALAILAVSLLSERPGLRAVRKLDIAQVVRERAA